MGKPIVSIFVAVVGVNPVTNVLSPTMIKPVPPQNKVVLTEISFCQNETVKKINSTLR